jgi:hypothetical protein
MKSVGVEAHQLVGRYRLIAPIGSGFTGEVWLARAPESGRELALRLLSEIAVSSRLFPASCQQLRHLSQLRPANQAIAQVHALGEDVHHRYVVTELVLGESLADRLRRPPSLTAQEAIRVAAHVAEALDWAHRAGIVHGAIKPANVFVGDQDLLKLTDFAINQGLVADRSDVDPSVDLAGCSPEQLAGLDTTPASDVYSLGVLLYRMLRGQPPFPGATPREVARQHIRDRAPSLAGLDLDVPEQVIRAYEAALAKDPDVRPSTRSFASVLRQAGGGVLAPASEAPASAHPGPAKSPVVAAEPVRSGKVRAGREEDPSTRPRLPRRRSPRVRAVTLAVIVALILSSIVAAVIMASGGGERSPAPPSSPRVSLAGIEVPDLVGLSASRARRGLLRAGLEIDRLVPVAGTPGVVLRTQPPPGKAVSPGTRVTLFVGVEPERLEGQQSPSPD